jgi:hypothetical protein
MRLASAFVAALPVLAPRRLRSSDRPMSCHGIGMDAWQGAANLNLWTMSSLQPGFLGL